MLLNAVVVKINSMFKPHKFLLYSHAYEYHVVRKYIPYVKLTLSTKLSLRLPFLLNIVSSLVDLIFVSNKCHVTHTQ